MIAMAALLLTACDDATGPEGDGEDFVTEVRPAPDLRTQEVVILENGTGKYIRSFLRLHPEADCTPEVIEYARDGDKLQEITCTVSGH